MDRKVIIMNGFGYEQIDRIMRAVKRELGKDTEIIFAKTTENSLKMKVGALIEDLTEDHEYLKNNPPDQIRKDSDSP
jgi:hypothetical protein